MCDPNSNPQPPTPTLTRTLTRRSFCVVFVPSVRVVVPIVMEYSESHLDRKDSVDANRQGNAYTEQQHNARHVWRDPLASKEYIILYTQVHLLCQLYITYRHCQSAILILSHMPWSDTIRWNLWFFFLKWSRISTRHTLGICSVVSKFTAVYIMSSCSRQQATAPMSAISNSVSTGERLTLDT